MSELAKFFGQLSGIGTELGILNLAFVGMLFALVWLVKRELKRIDAKVDPIYDRDISALLVEHDEMYDDFVYRQRREASGSFKIDDRKALAAMIGDILKEGE